MEIQNFKDRVKGKDIFVLCGGVSRERDVSLKSGVRVYESLLHQGLKVVCLDAVDNFLYKIKNSKDPLVVIMLHGKPGEDGTIQGVLEWEKIPYTGSGILASSICMDKLISKRLFLSFGVNTPPFVYVPSYSSIDDKVEEIKRVLGFPIIIKPRTEGSSLGVVIVREEEKLLESMEKEREEYGDFVVERFIEGKIVTIGILGTGEESFPLPVLELQVKKRAFYDYTAKYKKGETEFIIPAELDKKVYKDLQEQSLTAHRELNCRGFSRVDAIVSQEGKPYILEVNTIPGMTELSDLPAEAEAHGISYNELVLWILKSAYE